MQEALSRSAINFSSVIIKITGEALSGIGECGIEIDKVRYIASEVADAKKADPRRRIGIVIGGGNIIRGRELARVGINKVHADYMGMLGTVINSMTLQDVLEREFKVVTRTLSAVHIQSVAEPFIVRRAIRHQEKGRVVIFAGGTGNPHFTTDMAAVLRASEVGAATLLKATKVEGVYDRNPDEKDAKLMREVPFGKVLHERLNVMDASAIALARDNNIPVIVFDFFKTGNLSKVLAGNHVGSLIS